MARENSYGSDAGFGGRRGKGKKAFTGEAQQRCRGPHIPTEREFRTGRTAFQNFKYVWLAFSSIRLFTWLAGAPG